MDPACGLSNEYVAFEGAPAELLIKWRVVRLTEQQTEIRQVRFTQFIHCALHGETSDSLAAAVLARSNAAYAADLDVARVPLGNTNEQADMADDAAVGVEDENAMIGMRPCNISPRQRRHDLRRPNGTKQWRSLRPAAVSRADFDPPDRVGARLHRLLHPKGTALNLLRLRSPTAEENSHLQEN